jgi:hypothetical protein
MPTQSSNNSGNTRKRTNILKKGEASTIALLCRIMPGWITSDILTFIGFMGSIIVTAGLYLGLNNKYWLLMSIFGYVVGWFGDSLDGRLAYYRNIPRKWYGWALDISVDWITVGIMGMGYFIFFDSYKYIAFIFVFVYGWSMINSLLKYKVTDKYTIDTYLMGPTELRIIICIFLLLEIFIDNSLILLGFGGSLILIVVNTLDLLAILKSGDIRDLAEKAQKTQQA